MRKMLAVALAALFLINLNGQAHEGKWAMLAVISTIAVAVVGVAPRFGRLAASLFAYAMLSAGWVFLIKQNQYVPLDSFDRLAVNFFAADGIARFLLVILPFLFVKPEDAEDLFEFGGKAAAWFSVASAALFFYRFATVPGNCSINNTCGGLLMNPSISATAMVACLPFVRKHMNLLACGIVVLAAIATQTSVAIGVSAIYAALVVFDLIESKRLAAVVCAMAVATTLLIGYSIQGKKLLDTTGRFNEQTMVMEAWAKTPIKGYLSCNPTKDIRRTLLSGNQYLFGTGLGTFGNFSANIRIENVMLQSNCNQVGFFGGWWNMAHNDWLQWLFDGGLIGLALAIWLYVRQVLWSRRVYELEIYHGLVLYGLCAFLNPMLHLSVTALLGAWLLACSLLKYKHDNWRFHGLS